MRRYSTDTKRLKNHSPGSYRNLWSLFSCFYCATSHGLLHRQRGDFSSLAQISSRLRTNHLRFQPPFKRRDPPTWSALLLLSSCPDHFLSEFNQHPVWRQWPRGLEQAMFTI